MMFNTLSKFDLVIVVNICLSVSSVFFFFEPEQLLPWIASLFLWNISWLVLWITKAQLSRLHLIGLALVLLSVPLLSSPHHETDYLRYIFDGFHTARGENVYAISPEKPVTELAHIQEKLEYKEFRTIYPPLSQYLFAITGSLTKFKITAFNILFSYLMLAFLYAALWKFSAKNYTDPLSRHRFALLTLGHPLIALELLGNRHLDGFFVAALLLTFSSKHPVAKAFWASIALNIKYVVAFLLPLYLKKMTRKNGTIFIFAGVLFSLLLVSPLLSGLNDLAQNLSAFSNEWEMNSGVFRWLRELGYWLSNNDLEWGLQFAKITSLTFCLALLAFLYFSGTSLEVKISLFLLGLILVSPVVNLWYFSWLLPFTLKMPRLQCRLILFSFLALPLSYLYYSPGVSQENLFLALNIEHLWICLLYVTNFFVSIRTPGLKKTTTNPNS